MGVPCTYMLARLTLARYHPVAWPVLLCGVVDEWELSFFLSRSLTRVPPLCVYMTPSPALLTCACR